MQTMILKVVRQGEAFSVQRRKAASELGRVMLASTLPSMSRLDRRSKMRRERS